MQGVRPSFQIGPEEGAFAALFGVEFTACRTSVRQWR